MVTHLLGEEVRKSYLDICLTNNDMRYMLGIGGGAFRAMDQGEDKDTEKRNCQKS